MTDHHHATRQFEPDAQPRNAKRAQTQANGGAGLLQALQRLAGNRAVAGAVATAPPKPSGPTLGALNALGGRVPLMNSQADRRGIAAAGIDGQQSYEAVNAHQVDDGSSASVPVHDSWQSHDAAARLGAHAYTFRGHVALGAGLDEADGPGREATLAHEFAHVRQTRRSGAVSSLEDAESAVAEGHEDLSADPQTPHALFWLIPVAVGAYILLRPNVANAPSPRDAETGRTQRSVSGAQVAGEAVALFAVPGGVASGLARVGYGVIAASAVGGAASSVAFRGVQDVGAGEYSGTQAYIVDAGTGMVIGAVVGGGVRIFGGPQALGKPGPQPGLVHFTTPEAQQAILATSESGQAIGVLRGRTGIWALTEDALHQPPWARAARATMSTSTAQASVPIPTTAAGQFSRALPVGPVSAYQYAMGVYRAPAGAISMAGGEFSAASGMMPNIRGLFFPYGVDATIWVSAASVGLSGPASATADERGIRTILPSLPSALRPAIEQHSSTTETIRSDGPFVVLPAMVSVDAAIAGAQGSYDPVAEVCHGPDADESTQQATPATPPATIYVAPFWSPREHGAIVPGGAGSPETR